MGARPPQGGAAEAIEAAIEVFATGSTVLRDDGGVRPALDDPYRRLHPRDADAAPGHDAARPDDPTAPTAPTEWFEAVAHRHPRRTRSPVATTGGSRRGGGDVIWPMLVPPTAAIAIVAAGHVFADPLPHLRALTPDRSVARTLLWPMAIHRSRRRWVGATLHLLASRSMVVTVLELIPDSEVRFGRDRLLAHAVAGVEELAHRIEIAAR